MTTTDLALIRAAVAARLNAAIPGLNSHPSYPGVLNHPAAVVARRETRYDPALDIDAEHTLVVRLFVSFADLAGSQVLLDDMCAPEGNWSIRAAIDADPTLGGVVDFCRIATAEDERQTTYSSIQYLTVDLVLEVG